MPYDGQVGAEDAAEGFEDGVGAERDVVPGEVCTSAPKHDCQPDRGNNAGSREVSVMPCASESHNLRKTNAEDETKKQLLLGLQLQLPYHGDGHQEDPDIRYEVRDVGEVGECDHCQAFPRHV